MLRALDRETGSTVWEYDTSNEEGLEASFHGDPLVVEDLLLVGTDGFTEDGILVLEKDTGALRWKAVIPFRGIGARGVASDILVLDERVYATSLADELMCLSLADGVVRGIRLVEDVLYVGIQRGTVYAIKL